MKGSLEKGRRGIEIVIKILKQEIKELEEKKKSSKILVSTIDQKTVIRYEGYPSIEKLRERYRRLLWPEEKIDELLEGKEIGYDVYYD